jgi:hypothetical protein
MIIDGDPETFDFSTLPQKVVETVAADTFWCLSKLLEGIQVGKKKENYFKSTDCFAGSLHFCATWDTSTGIHAA